MKIYPHSQQRKDLNAAGRGNSSAFTRFYEQTVGPLFAYVRFHTECREEAEDIVSEVYLRLVRNLDTVGGKAGASPKAWLFTVARNLLIDGHRANGGRLPVSIDQVETIATADASPEQVVVHAENLRGILEGLQTLSRRQRELLTLRYFGGLRNIEIAELLDVDVRTVSSQITRGLQILRARLTQENDGHETDR